MILIWGISTDDPLNCVRLALMCKKAPVLFIDQQKLLDVEMDLVVTAEVCGMLRIQEETVELASIQSAYLRPYDSRRMRTIAQAGPKSQEWRNALELESALLCWAELTPALIINRPMAMASNNSKPYQASLISQHGFNIPETLVTTDPQAALVFWEKHRTVIYKSNSGIRSIVSRLGPEQRERIDDVANCPTQFQQYVPGDDYRVHVVGEDIFACQIISEADDYRYGQPGTGPLEIRTCVLPPDLAEGCRALTAGLGLVMAGIDLRRTPDGEWFCFEVNPSPGFTFYEEATGQPIGDAVAALLMHQLKE